MTPKHITTRHEAVACDVCGRRLLRGERADGFIAGGSRRMVCELCTKRAANEGWIREGLDASASPNPQGRERGSLLRRLRQRRDGAPPPPRRERREQGSRHDAGAPVAGAVAEPVALESRQGSRNVHAIPTNADLKMARALELFNASRGPRTVAGIARSLGEPIIAVRPSATEGSIVSIVVAWELTWYRYEVDLADEQAGVRVVSQGAELHELEAAEQVANAAADEHGVLLLSA